VSNNSGISPEQPKEKHVYTKKEPNKCQEIISNNIIEPSAFKN
jgi:hypothetical protein